MSKLMFDCIKTIYDMPNEKDCFYHYNEFVHTQDFEKLF